MLSWTRATELRQVGHLGSPTYNMEVMTPPHRQLRLSARSQHTVCTMPRLAVPAHESMSACLALQEKLRRYSSARAHHVGQNPHSGLGRMEQAGCEKAQTTLSSCYVARQVHAAGLFPVGGLCGAQLLKARQQSKGATRPLSLHRLCTLKYLTPILTGFCIP